MDIIQYADIVRAYATKQDVDVAVAVDHFMTNLAVMRDHYVGFSNDLNFRKLGQTWNKLSSDERLNQRANLLTQLKRSSRRMEAR